MPPPWRLLSTDRRTFSNRGGLHAHDRAVDTVQSFAATVVPMSRMLWSLSSMPRRSSRQETSATVPVSGPTKSRRIDQGKGVEPIHQKERRRRDVPRSSPVVASAIFLRSPSEREMPGTLVPSPAMFVRWVRASGAVAGLRPGRKQKAPGLCGPRSGGPGTSKTLARLAGLEPATSRVETGCSIQLSYRRRRSYYSKCLPCGRMSVHVRLYPYVRFRRGG